MGGYSWIRGKNLKSYLATKLSKMSDVVDVVVAIPMLQGQTDICIFWENTLVLNLEIQAGSIYLLHNVQCTIIKRL